MPAYVLVPTHQYRPRTGFAMWSPSRRVTGDFLQATADMRNWLNEKSHRPREWTYYPPIKCTWRCGFAFTDENLAFEFRMRWC